LIDDALIGLDVTDHEALSSAIQDVFVTSNFEMPKVSVDDIVETVIHAGNNTMSVGEYLEEHI